MNQNRMRNKEELGGIEEGEIAIRIYYRKIKPFFSVKKLINI